MAGLEALARPLSFPSSGRAARNRFIKGAMSERLASWSTEPAARGIPSPQLAHVYSVWGEGEIGVLLTGNIMVDPDHVEAVGNPIVPEGAPLSGERFDGFCRLAAAGKRNGSLMLGQISHPGRQCDSRIQSDPVSASDVQLKGAAMGITFAKPHAASQEEIKRLVQKFAYTAEYLEKTGFDGVEIHGAHGYLIAQFLSPTTNKRHDQYGGSIRNRARFLAEIIEAIRARTSPGFVVGVKLNSVEFQEGGLQPDDAGELCRLMEHLRVDFIELSGGTYESLAFAHRKESTRKREAFFIEFAEQIVPAVRNTRVYVTGGFQTAAAMANALKTVDGVGLGRSLCHEPHICKHILSGEVVGTKTLLIDQANIQLTNVTALMQIWRMAQGHEPLDLKRESDLLALRKLLAVYKKSFEAKNYASGEKDFRETTLAKM